MDVLEKKIKHLVDDNYIYASVLYYFGVKFFEYSDTTLANLCEREGLNTSAVINALEKASKQGRSHHIDLSTYSVDVIIEYLKHTHQVFVKKKLPYIASAIQELSFEEGKSPQVIKDLKWVFPLFVEDYIRHIYAEEDHMFKYILDLNQILKQDNNIGHAFDLIKKNSISEFAMAHRNDDGEMKGIRNITKNYTLHDNDLRLKVVMLEMEAFEKDLISHACIEDEILMPRALELEQKVKQSIADISRFN